MVVWWCGGIDQTDITLGFCLLTQSQHNHQCQYTWRDHFLGESQNSSELRIFEGIIFCRQVSDGDDEVLDDQKRRKKVKISAENLRDGGEWDFKSGGSYWNTGE